MKYRHYSVADKDLYRLVLQMVFLAGLHGRMMPCRWIHIRMYLILKTSVVSRYDLARMLVERILVDGYLIYLLTYTFSYFRQAIHHGSFAVVLYQHARLFQKLDVALHDHVALG